MRAPTASSFYTYDPYVIFDDEDELPMDEPTAQPDPDLSTTEGESLLLGVSQYS